MANGPETPLVMLDVVVLSPEKGDVLLIRREVLTRGFGPCLVNSSKPERNWRTRQPG